MRVVMLPVLLATALCSACLDDAAGCDFREQGPNGPEPRCQERIGLGGPFFEGFCDSLGGVAVEDGCPREAAVAACDLGETPGQRVIDVYYQPTTAEEAADKCADDDGELMDP